jgi:hypothetical protein
MDPLALLLSAGILVSGTSGARSPQLAFGDPAAPLAPLAPLQPGELIERTLAIVGGQPITLADVRTARALHLVNATNDNAATERLVERTLILREVERYAPAEPDEAAIDQRVRETRDRLPADDYNRVLATGGFTEARLRAWVRDDLRIESYLNQRFPPTTTAAGQSRTDLIADWVSDLRRRTPVVELWKK